MAGLLESGRFVPIYKEQGMYGLRTDKVVVGSFVDLLGIQSGDV